MLVLRLLLSLIVLPICLSSSSPRVLIVGAGPAGLLTAHCLLSRPTDYDVQIIESRDPPELEGIGVRAYSLGLNIRGQTAIQHFDQPHRSQQLWDTIRSSGVESDAFYLHIKDRSIQIRKPRSSRETTSGIPPTVLLPRNRLCEAMRSNLLANYNSKNLQIKYSCPLEDVDMNNRIAYFDNGKEFKYDLLIGADGVQSNVRRILFEKYPKPTYQSQVATLPGEFKVMVQKLQGSSLASDAVHLLTPQNGFGLFVIPGLQNTSCTLVNWKEGAIPPAFDSASGSIEEVIQMIENTFPIYGKVSKEAAEQLLKQQPSVARTVRCNTYTDERGVLLLGDAAHSTGGTLGQGANSALMDVVALDQALDAVNDDLNGMLPLFSKKQVKEGLALWYLLQLPPKGLYGVLYQLAQFYRPILKKLFPSWPSPVQTALSQSLTPFSEIVEQNAFWLAKAMGNEDRMEPLT